MFLYNPWLVAMRWPIFTLSTKDRYLSSVLIENEHLFNKPVFKATNICSIQPDPGHYVFRTICLHGYLSHMWLYQMMHTTCSLGIRGIDTKYSLYFVENYHHRSKILRSFSPLWLSLSRIRRVKTWGIFCLPLLFIGVFWDTCNSKFVIDDNQYSWIYYRH